MRNVVSLGIATLMVGLAWMGLFAQEKPKYTIKQVMGEAMKGGLCKKVASGQASKEDREKLVDLFTALAANQCPKGDAKDWETRTKALLAGAKAALADAKDVGGLKAAANCAECHKLHK